MSNVEYNYKYWIAILETLLPCAINELFVLNSNTCSYWGCPRGLMVKAIDCKIVVSEFELQSRYYVHFRTNTLGKVLDPIIFQAMG